MFSGTLGLYKNGLRKNKNRNQGLRDEIFVFHTVIAPVVTGRPVKNLPGAGSFNANFNFLLELTGAPVKEGTGVGSHHGARSAKPIAQAPRGQ